MNQNPTALNGAKESTNGAKVTVTLLGTGDAFASFGRSQAGYLIDSPAGRVLMEAGPGLMQALKGGGVSTDSFDQGLCAGEYLEGAGDVETLNFRTGEDRDFARAWTLGHRSIMPQHASVRKDRLPTISAKWPTPIHDPSRRHQQRHREGIAYFLRPTVTPTRARAASFLPGAAR